MKGKYTKPGIRRRFTMAEKDVERCDNVYLAIPVFDKRNREAADVWCALNPWSREHGGTLLHTQTPAMAYKAAASGERRGVTVRVIRITERDVGELLKYRDRFMVMKDGRPHLP